MSLAGIPPFSGFLAKLALIEAGLEIDHVLIVLIALGVSLLTLYSMLKIWNAAFWKPLPTDLEPFADGAAAVTPERVASTRLALMVVLPMALFIIFMILYLQFRSTLTTAMVFSGIFVAWSGGFLMIWLYGQDWFLNFSLFGTEMRQLF